MKYWLIVFAFPFMSSGDCGKKKEGKQAEALNNSVPACVRKIIDDAGKDIPPNTPEKVDEYLYNGKKAYLVTANCCDQYNVLYDENCKMICAPTGGFSGKGDDKCPDFNTRSKHVNLIWKREDVK